MMREKCVWKVVQCLLAAAFCLVTMGICATEIVPKIPEAVPTPIAERDWQADRFDAKFGVKNNNAPPERPVPKRMLPPLRREDVGVIRRVKVPGDMKVAALTFDFCELQTTVSGCDMGIVNFLRTEKLPATFFMCGKWMRSHARRLRQIMTVPFFEVANHAWSHGNCALLSRAELEAQVLATQGEYELVREKLLSQNSQDGQDLQRMPQVPHLFRLPYARSTPQALEVIAALGLRVVLWDVVAENGSDCTNIINARRAAARAAQTVRPGSIILLHANLVPRGSAQLLKELVALLRDKGYRFVTVGELLSLGEPETVMDGYFCRPGDNLQLDKKFGPKGTGVGRREH